MPENFLSMYRTALKASVSQTMMALWESYQFVLSLDHEAFDKLSKENMRGQIHAILSRTKIIQAVA